MGEYANYNGRQIKIGTCEDMYYLRADQRHLVEPLSGNVNPASEADQTTIRFRFPWPDEDHIEPGEFGAYNRGLIVAAVALPTDVAHYRADCAGGQVEIIQQAYRNGHLALVCRCSKCHAAYSLHTPEDVQPIIDAVRVMGEVVIADRIAAGYSAEPRRFAAHGLILDPGSIYSHLDDAMRAASCLCGLAETGATIYGTTDPRLADPKTGEAYVIAVDTRRSDGSTWPAPKTDAFSPVYTITRAKPRRTKVETFPVARPDGSVVRVTVPESEN